MNTADLVLLVISIGGLFLGMVGVGTAVVRRRTVSPLWGVLACIIAVVGIGSEIPALAAMVAVFLLSLLGWMAGAASLRRAAWPDRPFVLLGVVGFVMISGMLSAVLFGIAFGFAALGIALAVIPVGHRRRGPPSRVRQATPVALVGWGLCGLYMCVGVLASPGIPGTFMWPRGMSGAALLFIGAIFIGLFTIRTPREAGVTASAALALVTACVGSWPFGDAAVRAAWNLPPIQAERVHIPSAGLRTPVRWRPGESSRALAYALRQGPVDIAAWSRSRSIVESGQIRVYPETDAIVLPVVDLPPTIGELAALCPGACEIRGTGSAAYEDKEARARAALDALGAELQRQEPQRSMLIEHATVLRELSDTSTVLENAFGLQEVPFERLGEPWDAHPGWCWLRSPKTGAHLARRPTNSKPVWRASESNALSSVREGTYSIPAEIANPTARRLCFHEAPKIADGPSGGAFHPFSGSADSRKHPKWLG